MSVLALTKVACPPGSLEQRFVTQLTSVASFMLRNGELLLELKYDSGTMRFSRVLQEAHVTGTVTYRQRVALPAGAIVNVQLQDVSRADAAAIVLGEQTIEARGRQIPFSFEIRYVPGRIPPNAVIVVRAAIMSGGRLLFTTTGQYRVVTAGYPNRGVEIVVEPVR